MFRPPILNDVSENWSYSVRDDIACPEREQTETCHTSNEADNGNTLVPSSIGQLKVVRILDLAIQNLTNNTQDVDCRDDNRRTSNDSCYSQEDRGWPNQPQRNPQQGKA